MTDPSDENLDTPKLEDRTGMGCPYVYFSNEPWVQLDGCFTTEQLKLVLDELELRHR